MQQDQFHVTFETKKDIEQVITDLETKLKEIRSNDSWIGSPIYINWAHGTRKPYTDCKKN